MKNTPPPEIVVLAWFDKLKIKLPLWQINYADYLPEKKPNVQN